MHERKFHGPFWLIKRYFEISWISQKYELAGTLKSISEKISIFTGSGS